jgi:two-component system LytT family response regulator
MAALMTPPALRVVVAEDEPAARRHLVRLLRRHEDVVVVAECANGDEALAAAQSVAPDILFLDIQMPGLDGFDVVRALPGDRLPVVVFVTAHDDYAVEAFEVRALDYVLKPVDDVRFERAVAWARAHVRAHGRQAQAALQSLVAPQQVQRGLQAASRSGRLTIKHDGAVRFLPLADISHVTAESCYARIHTAARTYLIRESLASLMARLPDDRFARVHRSAIVNLDDVRVLEPLTHGESRLHLKDGVSVRASRHYRFAMSRFTTRHA